MPGRELLAAAGRHPAADLGQRLDDPHPGRQLAGVLGELGELDRGAALHLAAVGRAVSGQQADQRRLAGAVGADEPDALPGP